MKLSRWLNGKQHLFSNEDIKVGDRVFPLISAYKPNDSDVYVTAIRDLADTHMHGFPDDPHTITRIEGTTGQTDKGYSPLYVYFKEL